MARNDDAGSLDWDSISIGTPNVVDALQGTARADKVVLTDANAVDFTAGCNVDQGDTVDLSALLGERPRQPRRTPPLTPGSGAKLEADVDGAANGR